MRDYRNIWIKHYGPIPKDEKGRSYEIHHIDGNRNNNHISNLMCITIKEHYDIHYKQGDWGACSLMRDRMELSVEDKNLLDEHLSKSRIGENNPFYGHKLSESHMAIIKDRFGAKNPCAKAVDQIDIITGEVIRTFPTVRAAAKSIGVSAGRIGHVCVGHDNSKTSGGFGWRYSSQSKNRNNE